MSSVVLIPCHMLVAAVSCWAINESLEKGRYFATCAFSLGLVKSVVAILSSKEDNHQNKVTEITTFSAHMFTLPLINAELFFPDHDNLSLFLILTAVYPVTQHGFGEVTQEGIKHLDLITMVNIFIMMKFYEAWEIPEGIILGTLCWVQFFTLGLVSRITTVQWVYLYTLGFCLIEVNALTTFEVLQDLIKIQV